MMTLKEIGATAAALGNQVGAGIPIDQALCRMAQMQPSYAEFWGRTVQEVRSGRLLSNSLDEVWPKALVSAVRAGEQSGKMDTVFARIEETIELQMSLRGTIMQLAYPVGMGLAGLGVFLGFMVFVLPMLAKSLGRTGSTSPIFQLSAWLSVFVLDNYIALAVGLGVSLFAMIAWLKTEDARNMILDLFLSFPIIQDALRDMYFGLWANYMALMVAAGIPTTSCLSLTAPVLPGALRESVEVFERDLSVNNRSLSDSADLAKLAIDDPRTKWWPFYISNAFVVAEQTGTIDKELLRVAPALIKEGVRTLNRVVAFANVVALAVSALLIVSPLAAYYTEIFAAIRTAGR